MLFTKQQSADFIEQLTHKQHIKTALEAFMKALTVHLHIPVSIVNSGNRRVYESLMTTIDNVPNYTITTNSIQVSLNDISIDSTQNTAPHPTYVILKSEKIPYKFSVIGAQKRLITTVACQLLASNSLEALQLTEYIIDNLTYQKTFMFTELGIQYSASYSLKSTDFATNANKTFSYDNNANALSIDFSIDLELMYYAIRSASLVQYIIDNINTSTHEDADGNPIFNTVIESDIGIDTGDVPTIESADGELIAKYVGIVSTKNANDVTTNGIYFASDDITTSDLNLITKITELDL